LPLEPPCPLGLSFRHRDSVDERGGSHSRRTGSHKEHYGDADPTIHFCRKVPSSSRNVAFGASQGQIFMFRLTRHYCTSNRSVLRVKGKVMSEAKRQTMIVGCAGVLCLALYWGARFVPAVADTFPVSSFGKFVIFGIILAGAPLTTIADIWGSRWWWLAVAASAITLWDLYIHVSRVLS
jgi:hypothetical protein